MLCGYHVTLSSCNSSISLLHCMNNGLAIYSYSFDRLRCEPHKFLIQMSGAILNGEPAMFTERNELQRFYLITRAPCAAARQLSRRLARVSTSTIRASMPSSTAHTANTTSIHKPIAVITREISSFCRLT